MPNTSGHHRRAHGVPVHLVLTGRALDEPFHGHCGVCLEPRDLGQVVVWDTDELAICRPCFEAAAHFGRLSGRRPVLFDVELLP
jgi:hypothetical protein